jgi:hypothetical protein
MQDPGNFAKYFRMIVDCQDSDLVGMSFVHGNASPFQFALAGRLPQKPRLSACQALPDRQTALHQLYSTPAVGFLHAGVIAFLVWRYSLLEKIGMSRRFVVTCLRL